MATPRFNFEYKPENLPVTGLNPQFGNTRGQTSFRNIPIVPIPRPQITTTVDSDNSTLINSGRENPPDENYDGISDQKPEIIAVSDFKPLFKKISVGSLGVEPTTSKNYFDTILETKRVKSQNLFLEYDKIADESSQIKEKFRKIFQQNSNIVSSLIEKFNLILLIHKDVEAFKSVLDPRKFSLNLDEELMRNFPGIGPREFLEENIDGSSTIVNVEELLEDIGYENPEISSGFSNTKIISQILVGLSGLVQNRSLTYSTDIINTTNEKVDLLEFSVGYNEDPLPKVKGDQFPTTRKDVLDFCLPYYNWNMNDKNGLRGQYVFENDETNRVFKKGGLSKFYDALQHISTEISVSFSLRKEQKDKIDVSLIPNGSIYEDNSLSDARSYFSVLKQDKKFVFEPFKVKTSSNIVINSLLDETSYKSTEDSLGNIWSRIYGFESVHLDHLKKIGFIPLYSQENASNQVFSSKSLFENIYYRFYDKSGNPKWDIDELSSYVFSAIALYPARPSGFSSNQIDGFTWSEETNRSSNELKLQIFALICSDIGLGFSEKNTSSFNTRVSSIRNTFFPSTNPEDRGLINGYREGVWYLNSIVDPYADASSVSATLQSFKDSFFQTDNQGSFDDFKESQSEQKDSLYSIVSKTIKQFYYLIDSRCINAEGKTRYRNIDPFSILLLIFEIINFIVPHGMKRFLCGFESSYDKFLIVNKDYADSYSNTTPSGEGSPTSLDFKEIFNELNKRDARVRKLFSFTSGFLNRVKLFINGLMLKIREPVLQDFLKDLSTPVSSSSGVVIEFNPSLFSKQQASIAFNTLLDLQPLFSDVGMRTPAANLPSYKFVNSSLMGEKTTHAFFSMMKDTKFLSDGRIISVGVPKGLFNQILFKERGLQSWSYSQKDVILIKIFKIDLTRPDIVFKPFEKLFEISRLVARDDELLRVEGNLSFERGSRFFPTRDFDNQGDKSIVQYGDNTPFGGPEYSFLNNNQKTQIYQNHVESYLLEIYARIMSGIALSEGNIIDLSTVLPVTNTQNTSLTEVSPDLSIEQQIGSNISPTTIDNPLAGETNVVNTIQSIIRNILSDKGVVLESFATFDAVNPNNPSTLSPTEQIAFNVLAQKPYDKVVNLLVRNDDFIIDVGLTESFDQNDKDVLLLNNSQPPQLRKYTLKQREFSFERFFATIETISGEVI
jgi:hypothetical protein